MVQSDFGSCHPEDIPCFNAQLFAVKENPFTWGNLESAS
jgi:hypothetical protein